MITGVHLLLYAHDPDAARGFFRDVLGWRWVDAHGGWLIFGSGPSELGVHPLETEHPVPGDGTTPRQEISFMCDDLERTVNELRERGVEFVGDLVEQAWGRTAIMRVPGAGELTLYQPRHPTAFDL